MLTHLKMQIDQIWIPVSGQVQELLDDIVRDQASSPVRSQVWMRLRDSLYGQVNEPTYLLIREALWELVEEV